MRIMANFLRYWLPRLHKSFYKSHYIAYSSTLSLLLTSCLTTIKIHAMNGLYCETVYKRKRKNIFWFVKNSGEILY